MVLGRRTVSWGVLSRGVSGPKAAMELGQNTRTIPRSLATSRTLYRPFMFTFQASWGFCSPIAERMAAR